MILVARNVALTLFSVGFFENFKEKKKFGVAFPLTVGRYGNKNSPGGLIGRINKVGWFIPDFRTLPAIPPIVRVGEKKKLNQSAILSKTQRNHTYF